MSDKAISGYPKTGAFQTPEEVYDYFNAEKITCLLCGKEYKALAAHLQIHGISADEYKGMYGLPWRTGLTGTATRALNVEMGKDRHRKGLFFSNPEELAKAQEAAKNQRKRAPMRDVLAERNRVKMTKEQMHLTHDGKIMRVTEWAEKLGLHPATIYDKLNKGKSVKEALSIDFALLNNKQVDQIRKLLSEKISQYQIAEKYGVSQAAISLINTGKTHGEIK